MRFALFALVFTLAACADPSTLPASDGGASRADSAAAPRDAEPAVDGALPIDSGAPPAASCDLAGCGGDLVGLWTFDTACLPTRPAPIDDCARPATFFDIHLEGTLDFRADGAVEVATRRVQRTLQYYPTRCIRGGACESFFHGVDRCEVRDGYCDCVTESGEPGETSSETYRVAGSTLTFVSAEGETALTYCVEGDTLRYSHAGDRRPEHLHRAR